MHTAPFEERLDFYRYTSAAQYLDQARNILSELRTSDQSRTPDWRVHALWDAFFVAYSKPFKQQQDKTLKRGLRLPDDVIPPSHKETHDAIIQLRDKMYAHTDFHSLRDDQGTALNALCLQVTDRKPVFGLRLIRPRDIGIDRWLALIDAVIAEISSRGTKIWNRWVPSLNLPDNSVWILNVDTSSDDVLKQYK